MGDNIRIHCLAIKREPGQFTALGNHIHFQMKVESIAMAFARHAKLGPQEESRYKMLGGGLKINVGRAGKSMLLV